MAMEKGEERGEEEEDEESVDEDFDDEEDALDDEGTLDEEERFGDEEDEADELRQLEAEQEMPIDELKRRYCSFEEEEDTSTIPSSSSRPPPSILNGTVKGDMENVSSRGYFSDDEEDDEDYIPPENPRRPVRIGSVFQVEVPLGIENDSPEESRGEHNNPEETMLSARLLWTPPMEESISVEQFLTRWHNKATTIAGGNRTGAPMGQLNNTGASVGQLNNTGAPPMGQLNNSNTGATHPTVPMLIRDDESALSTLLDCHYDTDAALDRLPSSSSSSLVNDHMITVKDSFFPKWRRWSDEECDLFEEGLRIYGKNFSAIQIQLLPERRAHELVEFYYSWKKTERHDIFAQRMRLEKRTIQNPDSTDFMDNLLLQMEATTGGVIRENDSTRLLTAAVHQKQWTNTSPGGPTIQLPSLENDESVMESSLP